jgi:ParB family chromosome partitioning protein
MFHVEPSLEFTMAKQDDRSRATQSKLGRGLGSLIPVPISRAPEVAVAAPVALGAPVMPVTPVTPAAPESGSAVTGAPAAVEVKPAAKDARQQVDSLAAAPQVVFLPVRSIRPGKYQPRGAMDPVALESLARSIEQSGLMQPIVVRRVANARDQFELIAGERRWRAMDRLGRSEVPAIVQDVDDSKAAELSLIENLQREDLNPMDRAAALRRLSDEFSWTHQELSQRIGVDRATVTNLLRLNELDGGTAAHVRAGSLSMGHAKVLLGIGDVTTRRALAESAVAHDWSVRQLEAAVREKGVVPRGTTRRKAGAPASNHLSDLRRQLEEHLGSRVDLRVGRTKGAGELRIQFFSLDEFDGLMQRIGFKGDRFAV